MSLARDITGRWRVALRHITGWPNLRGHSPPTIAASESTDRRDCAPGSTAPEGTAVAGKMLFMIAAEMERDLIRERILGGLRAAGA